MKKNLELWTFIAKRLKTDKPVMLLTVVESSGSSPGRPGFKMAVDISGALCGSIGGGIMEVKLVELAKKRLETASEKPFLKRQIHQKTASLDRSGMICSGQQTILFTRLGPQDLKTASVLLRCLKKNRPAVLRLQSGVFQVLEDQKRALPVAFKRLQDHDFLFEENAGPQQQLYIIGGGHCALALSELMRKLDFYICLFDDRPGLSTLVKNRFVHEKRLLDNYESIGELIPSSQEAYVVVMTLGYRSDEIVLRRLLDKELKYIGVLGSSAKMAALLDNLRQEGFPEVVLSRIHTPIGLKINSRTPEEIAVSIAGEIIGVKNGAGKTVGRGTLHSI